MRAPDIHPESPAVHVTDEPDHRLGGYRSWTLELGAASPIDMVWISIAKDVAPLAHLVLPHGEPSIAIRRRRDLRGALSNIDVVVCGPFSKARWYHPEPGEELIAVRLKPEWAATVYDILPGEFLDADPVQTTNILAAKCKNALRAAENGTCQEIAKKLIGDLMSMSGRAVDPHTPEAIAASMLRNTSGATGVAELADALGVSVRHLRRRFHGALGMAPKAYARQLRVTAAALKADEYKDPDWAAIAAGAGYFDQAHMIADFKALCGQTPVEAHAARRAL